MLIRAAGAVAWRPGPAGTEVLLVHRVKYDDWSLAKGKAETGERLPVTAVREVGEESGSVITLGRRLSPARYKAGGNPKQVDYWSAQVTATDESAVPNHEVDDVAWLPVEEAIARVSYQQDVAVLTEFAAAPAATTPLILLRHAKAVGRSDWKKHDADRPLDRAGAGDAVTLAAVLACFAPRAAVVSSPALRCLDTVRPYAGLAGERVQAQPALGTAPPTGQGSAADVIASAIASAQPTIVCAHRENLPGLIDAALEMSRGPRSPRVPDNVVKPLPKGAFLAFHLTAGTLAALDRYELSEA